MKSFLKCHRQSPHVFALKCCGVISVSLFTSELHFLHIFGMLWFGSWLDTSVPCSALNVGHSNNSSSLQKQPGTGTAGFHPDAVCHSPSASLQNSLQHSKLKTSHQFYYEGKGKYFHSCCKIYLTFTSSAHWKYHRATKCPQSAGAAKVQTQVGSLDFIASE